MNQSSPNDLTVMRCCPKENNLGCDLWVVRTADSYSLGKFGTKTGAIDFAMGRLNDRGLQALKNTDKSFFDIDLSMEIVVIE